MMTNNISLLVAFLATNVCEHTLAFSPVVTQEGRANLLCRYHPRLAEPSSSFQRRHHLSSSSPSPLTQCFLASHTDDGPLMKRVSEEEEGVPIPFLDQDGTSFIECYADAIATIGGVEYTIGVPCDYCVALCYFENETLIPVELNDKLMDDIFPIAENIVNEEFGEDLALQRTPQTLTLVGELEDDDEDDEDDDDEDDDEDDDDDDEQVEVLLSFDHRDKEFNLVRYLDPVLLVGKASAERPDMRVLLSPEESEKLMPVLETAFIKFQNEDDSILP
jgi:hypothetical protein